MLGRWSITPVSVSTSTIPAAPERNGLSAPNEQRQHCTFQMIGVDPGRLCLRLFFVETCQGSAVPRLGFGINAQTSIALALDHDHDHSLCCVSD